MPLCFCGLLQAVAVSLHDVSEPQPLALPHYSGEIYIYVALVLGGVWMFSTAPLIIMAGLVVVSCFKAGGGGVGGAVYGLLLSSLVEQHSLRC